MEKQENQWRSRGMGGGAGESVAEQGNGWKSRGTGGGAGEWVEEQHMAMEEG